MSFLVQADAWRPAHASAGRLGQFLSQAEAATQQRLERGPFPTSARAPAASAEHIPCCLQGTLPKMLFVEGGSCGGTASQQGCGCAAASAPGTASGEGRGHATNKGGVCDCQPVPVCMVAGRAIKVVVRTRLPVVLQGASNPSAHKPVKLLARYGGEFVVNPDLEECPRCNTRSGAGGRDDQDAAVQGGDRVVCLTLPALEGESAGFRSALWADMTELSHLPLWQGLAGTVWSALLRMGERFNLCCSCGGHLAFLRQRSASLCLHLRVALREHGLLPALTFYMPAAALPPALNTEAAKAQ